MWVPQGCWRPCWGPCPPPCSNRQVQSAARLLGAVAWNGKPQPQPFSNSSLSSTRTKQTALCTHSSSWGLRGPRLPAGHMRTLAGWPLWRGSSVGLICHTRKWPWALRVLSSGASLIGFLPKGFKSTRGRTGCSERIHLIQKHA